MSLRSDSPGRVEIVNLCACGCGGRTGFAKQSESRKGIKRGDPFRFLPNHSLRGRAHHGWNGGYCESRYGYMQLYIPDHHRADKKGYVMEHVVVAENALKRPIKEPVVVHHVNGIRKDNRGHNLVICENQKYHFLLHTRERAFKACGNADWIICNYCKEYDAPSEMYISSQGNSHYHLRCKYERDRRRKCQ